MKMSHPIPSLALFAGSVSLIPPGPQTSSFQRYRRGSLLKSLWKKSTDSGLKPHRCPGQFASNAPRPSMQVTYFQRDTKGLSFYQAFTSSNPSSIYSPLLLHSLRAESRLTVTSDGICPIAHPRDSVPGSPRYIARIVPLTRRMGRTIFAQITREAAGDRPRKHFRE